MARRTPSRDSKLKQGRGEGHGASYTPFLTVRDVPSKGVRNRIKGWKTKRLHHLLSNIEKHYFYVLEWATSVIDIREQYPLPLQKTLEIANRLGIKHPTDPKSKEPAVITTDFLVDELVDGSRIVKARTVKKEEELNSNRVIEKFEIERTYWHENGIDWGIVVDIDIPEHLAKNMEWLHNALDPEVSPKLQVGILPQVEQVLYELLISQPDIPLSHTALSVDRDLGLKPGTSLWVVRHLIASRQWLVNMFQPLDPSEPLVVDRVQAPSQSKDTVAA